MCQSLVYGGNMEINEEGKFKRLFKRYGALCIACVFSLALALGIGLGIQKGEPVSTSSIQFGLPMTDAVIVKDYADDKLQLNESLNRWEIHLAIDFSSENDAVFSIYDGIVESIETNSLDGCIVTISHSDGFVSVYSSLNEDVKVSEGDSVKKGQQIGNASNSATNESKDGAHLHFVLMKDGVEVDPNNYLDLQNK